jgi:hypothetical protein
MSSVLNRSELTVKQILVQSLSDFKHHVPGATTIHG